MAPMFRDQFLRYGLAIVCTGVATGIHLLLYPYLGEDVPFITFFFGVYITAWFGGFGPTLLAVVLSACSAAQFFIPPDDALVPVNLAGWLGLVLFASFGVVTAFLSEWMRRKLIQLDQERRRFAVILTSIGDGVVVTDENARVTFLNPVAEELTGWPQVDAQGQPLESIFRILNEGTREPVENPVIRALRDGRIVGLANHTILIARDGTERAIDDSAAPIQEKDGQVVGVVLVFQDVTQKRAAQIARTRLAALVESSEDAILSMTVDAIVTDWNPEAERLFGYSATEAIGKPLYSTIVSEERKGELLESLQRIQNGERIEPFETERISKDGRKLLVSIRYSPISDTDGELVGVSAIDRDISLQRAIEQRRSARLAVNQILIQERNIDTAIRDVLSDVGEALQWSAGYYWRLQSDQNSLRCQEFWAKDSEKVGSFQRQTLQLVLKSGSGLPGSILQTGKPAWIPDVTSTEIFLRSDVAREVGLHGVCACPVRGSEALFGVLEWISEDVLQVDEDLLELLATLGGQLGQFIERRMAEQALRESEERYRAIVVAQSEMVCRFRPEGTILFANGAYARMLGKEPDQLVGMNFWQFIHPEDQPAVRGFLSQLKPDAPEIRIENRLETSEGLSWTLWINRGLSFDLQGVATEVQSSGIDITDRKKAEALLHESEERLRLALEAGKMGNWQWDITTHQVIWSPMLERLHGLSTGTFPGTFEAFQSDIHPEDREQVLKRIRESVEQGRAYQQEYRIIWPDGSVHWIEARGTLKRDDSGQPLRMVGICSDITERKLLAQQLEKQVLELSEAESRIRSVVSHVIDGILTIDGHGRVTSFNPAAERIFGYSAEEIIGKDVRSLIPNLSSKAFQDDQTNVIPVSPQTRPGHLSEVAGRRKDGSVFPMELAVSQFHWGQEQLFTGVVRDITERKRIEKSLRFMAEASKSLASLVDLKSTLQKVARLAVPDFADWCAVDMLDSEGDLKRLAVAHVDPEKVLLAEELYRKYPPAPDAPRGIMKVVQSGEAEIISEIPREMIETMARNAEHLRLLRELNPRSYMCVPLRTKEQLVGVMTFVSSESGRLYQQDDLAMAKDLVHRAAIAIENARLYQEVRDADRRKDEFLAMLAHELRNPLAPIRSGLDILAIQQGAHQETIKLMRGQLERVVRLVDDLLDVSRIMRGKVELRKEPVELTDLIHRSVTAIRQMIDAQRHALHVSLPVSPVWLHADPVRITQIIENLLNNAAKYTDPEGRIDLKTWVENDFAVIQVRDTGVGIEADLLPKVFDLFTQSTRSLDRSKGGLGIGLTLVQRLVEMHGGTVTAASGGIGEGSTFEVRLPVTSAPPQEKKKSTPLRNQQHRRILVVDDNVEAAWMLSMLLEMLGKHEVETVYDGPSALDRIAQTKPEIVLLDIGLPGMDGYEIARTLRASPDNDSLLLVALTGYGQAEDRRNSKDAGFDEHLVKPLALEQLEEILAHPKLKSGPESQ